MEIFVVTDWAAADYFVVLAISELMALKYMLPVMHCVNANFEIVIMYVGVFWVTLETTEL
jgi:hypothetical protein